MTSEAQYSPDETALLIVDPYNDFLSVGGKLWPRAKVVAEGVGLIMRRERSGGREPRENGGDFR